ncbi:WD40-repeat-containing domain protein [Kockovaella imperatae]|uniref:WD40-repeat-containing domain protein n=1 Tax=Kockovaella imperatae TaxID=4999 RepID=A0A1Y1UTM9_9TREE|nr:WD40-repeat-containing domain protein [Kockovaella imperatae]ORX40967.1 WD40-repeat-containing domain protein [Kockovaella imperatae]
MSGPSIAPLTCPAAFSFSDGINEDPVTGGDLQSLLALVSVYEASTAMQQLLNPFAQKYPETVDCNLPSQSTCCRFNNSGPFAGHYLAAGGSDGLIEIWDVETRDIIRTLEGHVKSIGSICWSRNNRYLLSASLDSTCVVWDLSIMDNPALSPRTPLDSPHSSSSVSVIAPSTRSRTIRFDAPVAMAEFHPRNSKIILATLTCNEVVLVDLRPGGGMSIVEDAVDERDMQVDSEQGDSAQESQRAILSCAKFSPCGSRIYAGSTQGELLIFDPVTRTVINRYKVANASIRQIAFDSRGQTFVCSASDRAVRVLLISPTTGALTPTHRFQDLVNRTPWNSVGFSGDGEYVMGGAGYKQAHNVFIWDRAFGNLVKVLEGPKQSLVDSDWHPTRPVIASISNVGDIHLWHTVSPDNWAAFAPGFEELEENVEYDEREDEFDIEDETEVTRRQDLEEDSIIDVFTPDDSVPRRPKPIVQSNTGESEETEEGRAARLAAQVMEWADREPDEDTWEGFFISLNLLEPINGTVTNGS